MKYLIVGSGFAGSVLAERLSQNLNYQIDVIDERSHIGGNCYTERDVNTQIMEHKYGPHIFHTSNLEVWDYIQSFCEMMPFTNRVKTIYNNNVYSLPINLHTINQFFNKSFSPNQAKAFIESIADQTITLPLTFEEQAIRFIGKDLYKAFFYGYTKKQWGCEPKELPGTILKRLPVRFNYDDNYYSSKYQGIPKNGYTEIFEKLLDRPNIKVSLNIRFKDLSDVAEYDHVFYSGPIDEYYDYEFGNLSYRTVTFQKFEDAGDYQGNAVINYANEDIPYTRIHEHKHFTPWEAYEKTIYFKEFSKETEKGDVPYYPKRLKNDMDVYEKYYQKSLNESKVTFIGRLGTYRYLDMHQIIEESLILARKFK